MAEAMETLPLWLQEGGCRSNKIRFHSSHQQVFMCLTGAGYCGCSAFLDRCQLITARHRSHRDTREESGVKWGLQPQTRPGLELLTRGVCKEGLSV